MRKLVWVGTDEAGYGPNIGPLCIGGSRFLLNPSVVPNCDFSDQAFLNDADRLDWHSEWNQQQSSQSKPVISDSKKAFSSGDSLNHLHRSVSSLLSFLFQGENFDNKSLTDFLAPICNLPEKNRNSRNPYWMRSQVKKSFPSGVVSWWDQLWFRPSWARVAMISEKEFNDGLKIFGNKASLLSIRTLEIAKQLLECGAKNESGDEFQNTDFIVDCDRHGGRKKYLPMLMEVFGADWIETREESKGRSIYYWDTGRGARVYFRFEIKGERRFPVAVSSMLAKYIRERAMELVNDFWQDKVKGLKSTAGYPVDAKRFLSDIQSKIPETKLSEAEYWRKS